MPTKLCPCRKGVFAKGRCIFHQRPLPKDRGKLFVVPIPSPSEPEGFRHNVLTWVKPLIDELQPYIWRWYFINHFGVVDVAFFPLKQRKCLEIVRESGFNCLDLGLLTPKDYGGPEGVEISYDALHLFSELRIRMMRRGYGMRADAQLMHYFLNQCGLDNEAEGTFHATVASKWLSHGPVGKMLADNWKW